MAKSDLDLVPLGGEGFNDLVKGRHGWFLFNRNDRFIGKSLQVYGEYCEGESQLFSQILKPDDIAIEAGANIGTHTVSMAKTVGPTGRIIAFEPQRVVFQTLCANIALNSLTNVETHYAAVGDEMGRVVMPRINYDKEENFGGVSVNMTDKGESVPLVALDKVLRLPRLKLLKIDVEGFEEKALDGAKGIIGKFKPAIYLENDRVENSESLINKINALGYKTFWHLPRLFNRENFAGVKENLFGKIVSVNMLCIPSDTNVTMQGFTEATDPTFHPMKK